MLTETTRGRVVSIIKNVKGVLHEATGKKWVRDSSEDVPGHAAFSCGEGESKEVIVFTQKELTRVCSGDKAVKEVTNFDEAKLFITGMDYDIRPFAMSWSKQEINSILREAAKQGKSANRMMEELATAAYNQSKKTKIAEDDRAGSKITVNDGTQVSGSVRLSPKQVEFLERMCENPGWDKLGVNGEYYVNKYSEELSDTMNSMAVGAIVTTLREKGVLETKRTGSFGGSTFKLTKLGVKVYYELVRRYR